MAELTAADYRGRYLCDSSGERVGTIDELYLDADNDQPEWAVVTGLHGSRGTFVPLRDAVPVGDEDVRVPVARERMSDAATIEPGGELSAEEEEQLFEYYGIHITESHSGARPEQGAGGGAAGEGGGRLRLRRYIVTEHVPTTVPVQHEEVRIEREDEVGPGPAQ
jgi:PRC-barrel domain/Domain of unknown function (DUF2382)